MSARHIAQLGRTFPDLVPLETEKAWLELIELIKDAEQPGDALLAYRELRRQAIAFSAAVP